MAAVEPPKMYWVSVRMGLSHCLGSFYNSGAKARNTLEEERGLGLEGNIPSWACKCLGAPRNRMAAVILALV